MNSVHQLENSASRSRSMHEGESSQALCDRLSRTRVSSPRQLPTDHDHAVPTREYQTDPSSPILPRLRLALFSKRQKTPHSRAGIDRVTPYQSQVRKEVAHTLRCTIRKGSPLRFDERAPDAWLDGGLPANVHHHEKQYVPHAQECQRNVYWLKLAQGPCTVPAQQRVVDIYSL